MACCYGVHPFADGNYPPDVASTRKRTRSGVGEEEPRLLHSFKRRRRDGHLKACPPHGPAYIGSRCFHCGSEAVAQHHEGPLVALNYMRDGLLLDANFFLHKKLLDLDFVQKTGKLLLVLDLDHTLLHSHPLQQGSRQMPDREIHVVESAEAVTKIRPFARQFLRAASTMYDLHIYTMGDRQYAEAMARLLDPEEEYFTGKVISREDSTEDGRKGLDVVLGHPATIVVLDDNLRVWKEEDRNNVIHMKGYRWNPDEYGQRDGDDILRKISGLLERIHFEYFYTEQQSKDVRSVMQSLKQEILRGCRLLLVDTHPWKVAVEEMGAICVDEEDDVTHIICHDIDSMMDAEWAEENRKMVLGVDWLWTAYYTWERPPEGDFAEIHVLC